MEDGVRIFLVAIIVGVLAVWGSRRIGLPPILLLLGFGLLLGVDGPWRWFGLPGPLLPRPSDHLPIPTLVTLGVALILFDGGLSLNLRDWRLAPRAVRNLISVGALVSLVGGMLAAHLLVGMSWSVAALFGALMIVTGPTVIVPILQQVRVVRRVHSVLLWEGILIDPVGAVVAGAVIESTTGLASPWGAMANLGMALVIGPLVGLVLGWPLANWLAHRLRHGGEGDEVDLLLALGGGFAAFALAEQLAVGAGLAGATVAGMTVGNLLQGRAQTIRRFKGTITTLLIALLFVLLAADFPWNAVQRQWPHGFGAIAVVILVVRPLGVWISTLDGRLSWRERLFVAAIGPRGIVAASVASLIAMILVQRGMGVAGKDLVALTFCTVMVTVTLSCVLAPFLAHTLKLGCGPDEGALIVGINPLSLRLASIYDTNGHPILLVDRNADRCALARQAEPAPILRPA